MKTREEVEALKQEWNNPKCRYIEYTVGFEEFFEELREFRMEKVRVMQREEEDQLEGIAKDWGCSVELVKKVKDLERKITELVEMFYRIRKE